MHTLFGALPDAIKRGLLRGRNRQTAAPANHETPSLEDPRTYLVTVRRDAVALGRFVKRLSVLGAERIQVENVREDTVCVRMRRPPTVTDWEAVVARLQERCGLV
jgi:hypothetical protein